MDVEFPRTFLEQLFSYPLIMTLLSAWQLYLEYLYLRYRCIDKKALISNSSWTWNKNKIIFIQFYRGDLPTNKLKFNFLLLCDNFYRLRFIKPHICNWNKIYRVKSRDLSNIPFHRDALLLRIKFVCYVGHSNLLRVSLQNKYVQTEQQDISNTSQQYIGEQTLIQILHPVLKKIYSKKLFTMTAIEVDASNRFSACDCT